MSRSRDFSVYENLDTAFVNLGALLRYLQERDFNGRVQVDMSDYSAEIRLRAGERPQVRELDRVTGREAEGEAALHRLLVRAQDAGGRIHVYPAGEATMDEDAAVGTQAARESVGIQDEEAGRAVSDEEIDRRGLLRTSAELIAAVERAARSFGLNFEQLFRAAQMELADDYSFLDPGAGGFTYAGGEVELHANPGPRAFVSGICELLRRVVEKMARGTRAASPRERVALELAVLVRRRQRQLREFGFIAQLDRIAGTRVI